jgi:hypothetical protein
MKQIIFTFENIKKIEVFADATLYSYFQIGKPQATFKLNNEQKTEIELREGEIIFKDKNNNLFKKIN